MKFEFTISGRKYRLQRYDPYNITLEEFRAPKPMAGREDIGPPKWMRVGYHASVADALVATLETGMASHIAEDLPDQANRIAALVRFIEGAKAEILTAAKGLDIARKRGKKKNAVK